MATASSSRGVTTCRQRPRPPGRRHAPRGRRRHARTKGARRWCGRSAAPRLPPHLLRRDRLAPGRPVPLRGARLAGAPAHRVGPSSGHRPDDSGDPPRGLHAARRSSQRSVLPAQPDADLERHPRRRGRRSCRARYQRQRSAMASLRPGRHLRPRDAFFYPALNTIVPMLRHRATACRAANALMQGTQQLTGLVGPAVAGLVVAAVQTGPAFAVDTISFAVAAGVLCSCAADGGGRTRRGPAMRTKASAPGDRPRGRRLRLGPPGHPRPAASIAAFNFAFTGPISVGIAWIADSRFGGSADFGHPPLRPRSRAHWSGPCRRLDPARADLGWLTWASRSCHGHGPRRHRGGPQHASRSPVGVAIGVGSASSTCGSSRGSRPRSPAHDSGGS